MARKTWCIFNAEGQPYMLVTALDRSVAEINVPQDEIDDADGKALIRIPRPGFEVLRVPNGTHNMVGLDKSKVIPEDDDAEAG